MTDRPGRLEIGENRAPRYRVPTWAGEWPVTADGREFAVIIEREHGYVARSGGRESKVVPFRPEAQAVWNWVHGIKGDKA